ncbi:MAG: hypothetical protein ABL966_00195 [Acidimicrobiales bacterium]
MRRVVLVEDDEWSRRGLRDGLADLDSFDPIFALSHAEATASGPEWHRAELTLVGAEGGSDRFDRFTGVRVVQEIRAHCTRRENVVVVLAGGAPNPLLHLRAAEAGADHVIRREDVPDLAHLEAALLRPGDGIRFDPEVRAYLKHFGLSPSSRLNAGLAYVEAAGLAGTMGQLGPRDAQSITRRRAISTREAFTRIVGVQAVDSGSGAITQRLLPSWKQVTTVIAMARGATAPPDRREA